MTITCHINRFLEKTIGFLLVGLLIIASVPVVNANNTISTKPTPDYGVYAEMNDVLAEIEDHRNTPDIINATEKRLEQEFKTTDLYPTEPSEEFELRKVTPGDPDENVPTIYEDMEAYESLYGKGSLLEFLMDRGISNYYIYTRYRDNYRFTRDFWRPVLVFPMDISNGIDIDIDDNPSTGDGNGNEIFVAFKPSVSIVQLPTIFPLNRTLVLRVGLQLEFRRLSVVNDPLTFNVIKYVSYQGKNYLVNAGVNFDRAPSYLNVELYSERVGIKLAPAESLGNFISNILSGSGAVIQNSTALSALDGPYHVTYELPRNATELISDISVTVGLNEVIDGVRGKVSWIMVDIAESLGNDHVPTSGHITLDSPNLMSPMDFIMWEGWDTRDNYMKCDVELFYYEETEMLIYATGQVIDAPGKFNVSMDYSKTVDGMNVTPIQYRAIDVMSFLSFQHTQFFDASTPDEFTTMGFSGDHVPRSIDVEITSDINREITSPIPENLSLDILTRMVDSLIGYVIERFARVGRVMGGLADGLTELPGRGGWMELKVNDDDHFGAWEFYRSSDEYLAPANGEETDYLTLMNRTGELEGNNGEEYLETMPMAGRITGINYLYMNFSEYTRLAALLPGRDVDEGFKMMFDEPDAYFYMDFSNLPQDFDVDVRDNKINLRMDGIGSSGGVIRGITGVYYDGVNYLAVRLEDVSHQISYMEDNGTLEIISAVPFGKIEFYLSDDIGKPFKIMEGNYARLYQDEERLSLNGRLHSLKRMRYKPGMNGNFQLEYENETAFRAHLYNYLDGGSEAKILIDPLPSNFSFDLPGAIGEMDIQLPDIINITGTMNVYSLVSSLSGIVDNIVYLSSRLTEAFLENIGGFSQEIHFAYYLQEGETLDILGYFRKGDTSHLRKVNWVHGISLVQDRAGENVGMEGTLYLEGMPKKGEIETNISGDDIKVRLVLDQWRPKNPWILVETIGIQDRDAIIYFNGLKSNIDFHMDVDLTTNMSIGGKIAGEIALDVSSNPGQLYVHLVKYADTTASTDILFSSVPTSMRVSLHMSRKIDFDYSATSPIKYIYLANSRLVEGKWYHINGLLHDVVEEINFTMRPDTKFDPDKPVLIQGLPIIKLTTYSKSETGSLDVHFKVDGRTLGQAGNVEIFVQDVKGLKGEPLKSRTGYRIESSGMSYFSLKAWDLPLMESFTIDYLEVCGKEIESAVIEMDMIFGVYPVFEFSKVRTKSLQVNVKGRLSLGSWDLNIKTAIINISTEDLGMGIEQLNDRIALTSRKHLIIPAPMLTFWATMFQ